MSVASRLEQLGLTLPVMPPAVGAYLPAVRTGELVFVSGQLPRGDGSVEPRGKLGREVSLEQGRGAARRAVLGALAVLQAELGSLERIRRVVRLEVFVNSAAGFTDQAAVADGASELLVELFGPAGRHARLAVGVAELPLDAAVELALTVEVASS